MQLVLGLRGLPVAEVALVKTIVRLSSSLAGSWTVAETGLADVLLMGDRADALYPTPKATVFPVLRRGETATGKALYRPIRAEELIELLNAEVAGRKVRQGDGSGDAPNASDPAIAIPLLQHARLRRWPPSALLAGRPGYVQMASLLAKSPMSVTRLAAVAGRPLQDCETFMRDMDASALLHWERMPAARAAVPAGASGPAQTLFSRIRHKLGIVRSGA